MEIRRFSVMVFCAALCAQAAGNRLFSLKSISELRLSPDGKTAVFVVSSPDYAADKTDTQLMMLPLGDGKAQPQPVPGAPDGLSELHWSPDGRELAYISGDAIWTQALTGAPHRVCGYQRTNAFLSKAGAMLAWSPDGTQLAFAGTTEPKPPAADPVVVTRILYKTRTAISDNRATHIYVVPAAGGEPRLLTPGRYDEHSLDWTPNGREIVFLSNRGKDPDALLNYDIYAVDVQTGKTRQITATPGVEETPKVSPDGRSVVYAATKGTVTTIDSVAEDTHIWVAPLSGGPGREMNAALDRRSVDPEWSSDGKTIYYLAADQGRTVLEQIPAARSAAPARNAQISAYSVAGKTGAVLTVMSDPSTPSEIYRNGEQVTHLNPLEGELLSAPETVHYRSFDGTEIEGWFYPALSGERRVPMILSIHGGPHGQFGYAFNPGIQSWAEHGYATLILNPRGSAGYGQKFSNGTLSNWGGGDYRDLMAGVDAVLKSRPNVDPERLGVTGGSYGGFMTNWVITQTHRFKAAVAVASLSDMISFYATSLYQDLVHAEFNGFPWSGTNFATLWKWSPLAHIAQVTTPTLFLHGESDNDVHITQAEEMYTGLRQRGITAELVRYPREGHGFHEPKHVEDSRRRTLEWMDRYLKPGTQSKGNSSK